MKHIRVKKSPILQFSLPPEQPGAQVQQWVRTHIKRLKKQLEAIC